MEHYKPNYYQEFYNRVLSYKGKKVSVYLRTNEKLIGTLNQVGISQNKPYVVLDVGDNKALKDINTNWDNILDIKLNQ